MNTIELVLKINNEEFRVGDIVKIKFNNRFIEGGFHKSVIIKAKGRLIGYGKEGLTIDVSESYESSIYSPDYKDILEIEKIKRRSTREYMSM
ncbi:hypothetical protein NE172_01975 [Clostridium botulinum]|uniref:Uncharacterized protein n=1 Tax=Clostridium botulinum TaxID=1491 RepID=A0A6B4JHQ0_CLOBO|nr:hypothetical protein [Clostridium botulinum]EES49583.1 hypothetical protein CLO_0525 [Clostridium botulinum E1 str. 'BoNT E Beluga']MBY6759714.1 hypothetical protein [Clostridium botulinum]MBY6918623.1 hypothetical protein [Clostridium botulinum]MCR1129707.1 hypothetical protein [Clostridium botulinum]NFJ56433.1 hypothetical protein [Clostridium botulinum]